MVSYAVEVHPLPVRLHTRDGGAVEVEVFLHTVGESGRPETLGDRLNDPHLRFLPCRVAGRVELVHLERLVFVEALAPLPELQELEEVGAVRQPVEVDLADGRSLRGTLVYSRPAGSQRVSDLLNAGNERFLLLVEAAARTLYVRRDELLRVRA
jgi:hypothetical protein